MRLQPFAENVWTHNAPLSVLGMSLGHRMTVVRHGEGGLWVHSPTECTEETIKELSRYGELHDVIAPNRVHDTYLEGWFQAYPSARFHAAPGLADDRADLKFTDQLGAVSTAAWSPLFDCHVMAGMPRVNEVVFLHRPTRTLILTDLAFNLGPEMPWLSRLLLRLNDWDCKLAPSRLLRSTIKDRAAFRASLELILSWDFDRVVLSHGENLPTNGRELLREALAFL